MLFQRGGCVRYELLGAGDEPAVQRAQLDPNWPSRKIIKCRPEALDVRVSDKKPDRVPQREEFAFDLVRGPVDEK